jgi:hypothetical protein
VHFLFIHNPKTYEFDKVIFALPPNMLGSLMDFPADEKALLQTMTYHQYGVGCIDPDSNIRRGYY